VTIEIRPINVPILLASNTADELTPLTSCSWWLVSALTENSNRSRS